jgi:ATP-dependent Lon protease
MVIKKRNVVLEDNMNNKKGEKAIFLPVLPLKNLVTLPKSIIPVVVGRDISIKAVDFSMNKNQQLFVSAQKSADVEDPSLDDIFHVGTRAQILQVARMPNGTLKILIEGICRARIVEQAQSEECLAVISSDLVPIELPENHENSALWRSLHSLFKDYVSFDEKVSSDILDLMKDLTNFDHFTDTIAVQMRLNFVERQQLLETVDLKERALQLIMLLDKEVKILRAEKKIRDRVAKQVDKHQKDYYLTEQMRAIQRELGKDDYLQEIIELRKKAKENKLSKEALVKVNQELKRLEQMPPLTPESSVSRNYVEWLISLPWSKRSKDVVSIEEAENLLDSSHSSMQKPKERIIEFLAARKFAGPALKRSPIICLVGPPGVGKTSLAQSIASALGRKIARISLGGMRDEAEIRGHRRTYIGAMPGKIIQSMKKVGVVNPVLVLDEIDKMSMDFRGDPASALLEVLDPEQNKEFSDYFLEVGYDLSQVLFVTTANVVDNIPYPLLDRMEIIGLSGYAEKEKLDIAKRFLIPKLLKEHALKKTQIVLKESLLEMIVEDYTKEAGVRQLERVLAKILRKSIQELLKNTEKKVVSIKKDLIEKWLGVPQFKKNVANNEKMVGLVTGLAWTEVGGDILEIEVTVLKGKGALTLTGQLGEVMQESAQAAMSYIRSRAKDLQLKEDFYSDYDIHIHIPEGAIPKDGPSAGTAMAIALISALTKIPVYKQMAMTGEVTLRGRVLPVGGLKEKLLAATRFGIVKVLVPKSNEKDIKEFKELLDSKLKIVYVDAMDEVVKNALEKSPFKNEKTTKNKNIKTKKKTVKAKK